MRIAWCTPFNPRSAIGNYSEIVAELLASQDEIVIFASDTGEAAPRPSRHPVVELPTVPDAALLAEIDSCDLVVYNMGDNLPYHHGAYELSLRRPGIVVLHDIVMRDFFKGYSYHQRDFPKLFTRMLVFAHGSAAEDQARQLREGEHEEQLDDPLRLELPLFRPVIQRATGVIVHSEYARNRVSEVSPAPVVKLEFPLPQATVDSSAGRPENRLPPMPPGSPPGTAGGRTGQDGHARPGVSILTFGVLNQNKLVDKTIRAIAGSPVLRAAVTYTVIGTGPEAYCTELARLVEAEHLGGVVRLAGYQPDHVLDECLAAADIVVNLRNPHLGESSWSLLMSVSAGIPTLVWDHGYYGEFPDNVVCKINDENEIRGTLERLVSNRAERLRIGQNARAHAQRRFAPAGYATGFRQFVTRVESCRPVLDLADRVSTYLVEFGSTDTDGLQAEIADEIAEFLPAAGTEDEPRPVLPFVGLYRRASA